MSYFDHERMDVYQVSLQFVVLADEVANTMRDGRAALGDQLRRASTSIVLNIAEGAGEYSRKEKARFYRMASRSATERAAILDIWRQLKSTPDIKPEVGREMLLKVVAMLVKLGRARTRETKAGGREEGRGKAARQGTGSETGTGTGLSPRSLP